MVYLPAVGCTSTGCLPIGRLLPIISFLPRGRIWLLRGRLPPTTGCYPATGCCPARGSLPISIPRVGSWLPRSRRLLRVISLSWVVVSPCQAKVTFIYYVSTCSVGSSRVLKLLFYSGHFVISKEKRQCCLSFLK